MDSLLVDGSGRCQLASLSVGYWAYADHFRHYCTSQTCLKSKWKEAEVKYSGTFCTCNSGPRWESRWLHEMWEAVLLEEAEASCRASFLEGAHPACLGVRSQVEVEGRTQQQG